MKTIGLMMVVRNERERLAQCLDWHIPFIDEVVICDQQSDDETLEVIKTWENMSKIPFHILKDKNWGFCEPSKQHAADILKTDWILYVDPDEKFPLLFLERMHKLIEENSQYNGYNLERKNIFEVQVFTDDVPIYPKKLSVVHPKRDPQLRLTKKSVSIFPPFLHNRVRITGLACDLPYEIEHIKTVSEQWEDNKRYKIINTKTL